MERSLLSMKGHRFDKLHLDVGETSVTKKRSFKLCKILLRQQIEVDDLYLCFPGDFTIKSRQDLANVR